MSNQNQRISNFMNPIFLLFGFCLAFFVNITATETGFAQSDVAGFYKTSGISKDAILQAPVHFIPADHCVHNTQHVLGIDEEEECESEIDEHFVFQSFLPVIIPSATMVVAGHDQRERKTEATHFVQSYQEIHTLPIYLLIEVFRI